MVDGVLRNSTHVCPLVSTCAPIHTSTHTQKVRGTSAMGLREKKMVHGDLDTNVHSSFASHPNAKQQPGEQTRSLIHMGDIACSQKEQTH